MRAHVKTTAQAESGFDQYDPDRAIVRGRSLGSFQYSGRILGIGTIHNDGFETLASEFANGGFGGVDMLDRDLKIAENAAQDAHRFLIATH
jgi:hypothetical protein